MKKLVLFIAFFLPLSFGLTGCGAEEVQKAGDHKTEDHKLNIFTTVYPLQYFTEQIGKDLVHVESIYPPGTNEHTFEPSQRDMIKLAESDLFIYIGLGLEGFVNNAKEALKKEDVILLPAGENIDFESNEGILDHEEEEHDQHDQHNHGDIDPHVWLDPVYAMDLATAIKDELIRQLPDQKEQLEENYTVLANQLTKLNEDFQNTIKQSKHKEFIVSHAAYGYWEKRYGIKQISISDLSNSREPTPRELENIISTAKKHGLKYIFFEQNVNSKTTEIIKNEIGASPLYLHNLSVLTDEDLSKNRTYFSIMEDNLKALDKGLN